MSLPPHSPETSLAHKKITNISESRLSKALLRFESAPVDIPVLSLLIPLLCPASTICHLRLPFKLQEPVSPSSSQRISCSRSSRSSRSSSRPLQDDFDKTEFPCPFDAEDDEMMDPGSRAESYDRRGHPADPNDASPPLCQDISVMVGGEGREREEDEGKLGEMRRGLGIENDRLGIMAREGNEDNLPLERIRSGTDLKQQEKPNSPYLQNK
ncbi:hypothetical protein F3Y22_tig00110388pilonHSYRG00332 [Hibiscus syriacus]|uniref:Uncharacterized protein n=1 Tax=Hibiscus syriacus TaxID=106335 RepID=A0A6A3AQC3_HIBSY|nr:hypothetical protein F3Y22_tig00110388pilonHSYRG00332 [Hibiscus syriacus]